MRELGYRDGENIVIAYRFADGDPERLPALAAAAVAEHPDLFLTPGPAATHAVATLTPDDPDRLSHRRPGRSRLCR